MKAVFNSKREEINSFYLVKYPKLEGAMFHFQSPIEILFVNHGKSKVWINNVETTLSENEIAVVSSYDTHCFSSYEDGEYIILFVSPNICPAFMEAVHNKNTHYPIIRDNKVAETVKSALDKLSDNSLNSIEQIGYIHIILGSLLKQLELKSVEHKNDYDLNSRLFIYINEHYKEDITAEKIAKSFGYEKNYLLKCFRKKFGMSIGEYINTLRLKNAVTMLRNNKSTILECALESGFSSIRTFYRVFTEEFGCAPRDYINKNTLLK